MHQLSPTSMSVRPVLHDDNDNDNSTTRRRRPPRPPPSHTTLAQSINSQEVLLEHFRAAVRQVDRECDFCMQPSSLTLFPVNVKDTHAVILCPGAPLFST